MKVKLICSVCAETGVGEILWQDKERKILSVRANGYFLDTETPQGVAGGWFCSRDCLETQGRHLVRQELPTSRPDEPIIILPIRKEDLH